MTHSSPAEVELTPRRREVLELIARGLSSAEIAARLHRSIRTVESHRHALNKQLGTRNSVELVRRAMELRLIDEGDVRPTDRAEPAVMTVVERRLLEAAALLSTARPGAVALELACAHVGGAVEAEYVAVIVVRPAEPTRRVVAWSRSRGEEVPPPIDERDRQQLLEGVEWSRRVSRATDSSIDEASGRFMTGIPLGPWSSGQAVALLLIHERPLPKSRTFDDVVRAIAGRLPAECAVAELESRVQRLQAQSAVLQRKAGVATLTLLATRGVLQLGERARDLLGVDRLELTLEELADLDRRDGRRAVLEPVREAVAEGREFLVRLELRPTGRTTEHARRVLAIRGQPAEACPVDGAVHLCFAVPLDVADGPAVTLPFATLAAQFVERCPDPVVLSDTGGRIVVANTAWRTIGGTTEAAEARCGDATELSRCLGDETAQYVTEAIDRVVERQGPNRVEVALDAGPAANLAEAIEIEPVMGMPLAFVRLRPAGSISSPPSRACTSGRLRPAGAMPDLPRAALFDWIFDELLISVAVGDLEGRSIRTNQAFRDSLGWSEDQLGGMPWTDLVADRDQPRVREQLSRLMAGRGIVRVPIVMRHADGSERILEWSATPPLAGTSVFLAVGVDVTEQFLAGSMVASLFSGIPPIDATGLAVGTGLPFMATSS